MTKGYDELLEEGMKYFREINPFKEWLGKQSDFVQKAENKVQQVTYDRQVRGAALDVARFLLPQATLTNIAWIQDARSMEYDIAAWKGHPLFELRETAELIEKNAGQVAPSLLKYTEKNDFYGEQLRNYRFKFGNLRVKSFKKGAQIISFDKNALNNSVAFLLHKHSVGGGLWTK
jgi:thymidylate synthase ThyX